MQDQTEAVKRFCETTSPARLSRNLRNLLLHYQSLHHDGHPFEMEDLLTDTLGLFELLDKLEEKE